MNKKIIYLDPSLENAKLLDKENKRHQLVNLIASVYGDISNIKDGIVNDKQIPRMICSLEQALNLVKNL